MGGTLFGMTPYALSALVGLRDELPLIADCVAWARSFAGELVDRGLRIQPDPPHTNTFFASPTATRTRSPARHGLHGEGEVAPCGGWWPARAPASP